MRLTTPIKAPEFAVRDVHGHPVRLADYHGRRVLVSFFRDARCPFCNFRIYELTHRYTDWQKRNLEVLAFFSSEPAAVREHVAKYPRPFTIIGDPELEVYARYRVERSWLALLRGMMWRMPRMFRGMRRGGGMTLGRHKNLVPADFLIDEHGLIQEIWYGRDIGDHIPLSAIERFVEKAAPVGQQVIMG